MRAIQDEYSENTLIEQPAIELFLQLDWETADCFHEFDQADGSPLGRETKAEVVLISRLRPALKRLNPDLPQEAINLAIEELTRDRSSLNPTAANREIYQLICRGAKVPIRQKDGSEEIETVKIVDFDHPENNDFFLASQFWVTGEMGTGGRWCRRALN